MNEHEIYLLQEGLDALLGNVRRTQSSLTKPSAILYIIYIESLSITITLPLPLLTITQHYHYSKYKRARIRVTKFLRLNRPEVESNVIASVQSSQKYFGSMEEGTKFYNPHHPLPF